MYTTTSNRVAPVDPTVFDQVMRLATTRQLVVASAAHPGETGRVVGVHVGEGLDGQEFLILQVEFLPNESSE